MTIRLLHFAAVFIVARLFCAESAVAASCVEAPPGLVGWWSGDGTAQDLVGTNHSTLGNGATYAEGMVGQAFKFDGVDDYVEIPDSPSHKPTNITVSAWVKFEAALDHQQIFIFKKNSRGSNFEAYQMFGGDNKYVSFEIASSSGQQVYATSRPILLPQQWYHVAGTYDRQYLKLYVNGQLEASTPCTFPLDYGTRPLFFGQTGEWYERRFKGLWDEVAIFSRALSSNEIASIYAAGSAGMCTSVPSILIQPKSQGVEAGSNLTLNVVVRGMSPLTYQWRFNGLELTDGGQIAGSAKATLLLTNVQTNNTGAYDLVISNSVGSVTSAVTRLLVGTDRIIHVAKNATGPVHDGRSWSSAFITVAEGLNIAVPGTELWVATGAYVERITLKDGVGLYGGFTGTETTRDQRDWRANVTTLNGNQGGSTVTSPPGITEATVIDGFTIRNGKADSGGGICCDTSSPTILHNRIIENDATNGGGIACPYASPLILNNEICHNTARYGGGVSIRLNSSPLVASNIVAYNIAAGAADTEGGGIISHDSDSPIIIYNQIISNRVTSTYGGGGGISCGSWAPGSSREVIANNLIKGNISEGTEGGGGIGCQNESLTIIINNTIIENNAPVGGGISVYDWPDPGTPNVTIVNNIIAFNSSGLSRYSGIATVRNNCVFGNSSGNYVGISSGAGGLSSDPLFLNKAAGDYRLSPESPCIDAGDNGAIQQGWLDLDGYPRIRGSQVDIGAYEYGERLRWAIGYTNTFGGDAIAVDASGNSYVTGWFTNTVVLGNKRLTSLGHEDIFVAKYDSTGELLWIKQAGGIGSDGGTSIALDAAGNYYVSGYCQSNAVFEATSLASSAGSDNFVAKYSSSGEVLWVKKTGGFDEGHGPGRPIVAVDTVGNCYVTGSFVGTASFDDTSLTSSTDYGDMFVAKFAPTGSLVWVRQGRGHLAASLGIAVASTGESVVSGFCQGSFENGTVVFGSITLSNAWQQVAFVAKYDSAGTVLWVKQAGRGGSEIRGQAVGMDPAGNSYVAGEFRSQAAFGGITLTAHAGSDLFLAKYDPDGRVIWVRQAGGNGDVNPYWSGVAVDRGGNSFMTGLHLGTVDFGGLTLTNAGRAFVVKYDNGGNARWAIDIPGGPSRGIGLDAMGNIYVTSELAIVTALSGDGPLPVISLEPASQTVPPGANVTFAITASSPTSLSYQWQRNGVDIAGAVNPVLELFNVIPMDACQYSVIVSNAVGPVTSLPAFLTLTGDAPVFAQQPQDQQIKAGQSLTLSAPATGWEPIVYQWFFNDARLASANQFELTISSVQTNNSGRYFLQASNYFGVSTSATANVTVFSPLKVTNAKATNQIQIGQSLTLRVTVEGEGPFQYQWQINGEAIPGATNDTYAITNIQPKDGGFYRVLVANEAEVLVANIAEVVITVPPAPAGDYFTNRIVLSLGPGVLRTTNDWASIEPGEPRHAGKEGGHSIWFKWIAPTQGNIRFSTAGSSFDTLLGVYTGITVTNLTPIASDEDRGGYLTSQTTFAVEAGVEYQIAIDGFAGATGSVVLEWAFEPTPDVLPQITAQPQSQMVAGGGGATLGMLATSVQATGVRATGVNLRYQWYRNGGPIAGATNSTLALSNVGPTQVGGYTVHVINETGTQTNESEVAFIEVYQMVEGQATNPTLGQDKLQDLVEGGTGLKAAKAADEPAQRIGTLRWQVVRPAGSPLVSGYTVIRWGDTRYDTTQLFENVGDSVISGHSRWQALVVPYAGICTLSTEGSGFDTVLEVLQMKELVPVRVAYDDNSGSDGKTSWLQFEAEPGQEYYVRVAGVGDAKGRYQLREVFEVPQRYRQWEHIAGEGYVFTLQVPKAMVFRVDGSTDLKNWEGILSTNSATGLYEFRHSDDQRYDHRFYRAILFP